MNILLVFFALPISIIIFSIALQKILKCPAIVASLIFAVFLIIPFILNDLNYLIGTIIYTVISYLTAVIVQLIHNNNNNVQGITNDCQDENINTYLDTFNCVSSNGIPTRINLIQNQRENNCNCRRR